MLIKIKVTLRYLVAEHPEWFDYNLKGECLTDIKAYLDSYKFLNPAVPDGMCVVKNKNHII